MSNPCKYEAKNLFISWESEDTSNTNNKRLVRMLDRAKYMVRFWQEEVKFCQEALKTRIHTQVLGITDKKEKNNAKRRSVR